MKSLPMVSDIAVRALGAVQLLLGIAFWTGRLLGLVQLHMLIGVVFVLALWTVAFASGRAGTPVGLVVLALVWGLLLAGLGATHARLVPGSGHWIIQVTHLLTAMIAMGLSATLAARAKRASGAAAATPAGAGR